MNHITELCRNLRSNPTMAEKLIWHQLRKRHIEGVKFLRQFPIFTIQANHEKVFYIADFYCAKYKLVIEVDGPVHLLKREYDANRDIIMNDWGFSVLRFTNAEVENEIDKVVGVILDFIYRQKRWA
ncbi:MAG: endonuclease domain-containing protein [Sphingobacteriaceae bacterium]|nr:MAG: endonuclease domain-containing protein [Sphingobacteriaceae bacterium]